MKDRPRWPCTPTSPAAARSTSPAPSGGAAARRPAPRAHGARTGRLAATCPDARLAGTARRARGDGHHERALGLTVSGDATVDRVTSATAPTCWPPRGVRRGLEYTWPANLVLGQLTLAQPSATIERAADGTLGLATLLRPPPADTSAPVAPAPAAATPDVRITSVRIDDGRAVVTDAASGGRVDITRLALTARDVTWPAGPATLELTARSPRRCPRAAPSTSPAPDRCRSGLRGLYVRSCSQAADHRQLARMLARAELHVAGAPTTSGLV